MGVTRLEGFTEMYSVNPNYRAGRLPLKLDQINLGVIKDGLFSTLVTKFLDLILQ